MSGITSPPAATSTPAWINPTVLSKLVAVFVLFSVFLGAAAVALLDLIRGQPVPSEIITILAAAVTYSVSSLGLERGVTLVNSDTATAIKTLAAQVSQQSTPGA